MCEGEYNLRSREMRRENTQKVNYPFPFVEDLDSYEEVVKHGNKGFDLYVIIERDPKGKRATLVEKSTGIIINEVKI